MPPEAARPDAARPEAIRPGTEGTSLTGVLERDPPPSPDVVAPVRWPALFASLRIVAGSTLLSRLLGMLRDIASARLFGTSPVWDAFAIAFRIPNLARRLFGEGALSAAFLPVFAQELQRSGGTDRRAAWQLASAVFTLLAAFLSLAALAGELVLWLFSRYGSHNEQTELLLGLTAVMLPYAVLICLAAQVSAVLHALGHFTWPALVPVVLNLCWIGSIWLIDPLFEPDRVAQAFALAACVVLAGVLQLTLQWPVLRGFGFRFDHRWHEATAGVKQVLWAMLPVALGLSVVQINALLDNLIAWGFSRAPDGTPWMPLPIPIAYPLEPGAVSVLYYGERVYQFPLGVFGVALGTVLFPLLSLHAARGEIDRLRQDLGLGLRLVMVIGIPASLGLMLLAQPLTQLLLRHGQFTDADATRTAAVIAAYSAGVWAYCANLVLYRGFYALGDQRTPVRIAATVVAFDLLLNLTLIWPLAERGLAFSTAVAAAVQMLLLIWFLQRKTGSLDWKAFRATTGKTLAATAVMGAACLIAIHFVPAGPTLFDRSMALVVPCLTGLLTFFAGARLLKVDELGMLLRPGRGRDVNDFGTSNRP